MKTIITITLFTLFATTTFAQASAQVDKMNDKSHSITAQKPKVEHSQAAVTQLRKYLAENLDYPASMINNGVEGIIVVEVKIMENGKIEAAKIKKGLHATLDSAVLKTMHKLKKIDTAKNLYEGVATVYVPVISLLRIRAKARYIPQLKLV